MSLLILKKKKKSNSNKIWFGLFILKQEELLVCSMPGAVRNEALVN